MSKRGHYSGGHTQIFIGSEGTSWPTEPEVRKSAESKVVDLATSEQIDERKMLRSFISQCAKSYSENELGSAKPNAPKQLRYIIRKAGGNIKWLAADEQRQRWFHQAYCKFLGREVPFKSVWAK